MSPFVPPRESGRRTSTGALHFAGAALVVLILTSVSAVAQTGSNAARPMDEDSVVVVAGTRYEAGELQRLLLGDGYRDLWTTPIEVPLLRPDTFAGGLTLLQPGESLQTPSLRFADESGLQYVFRSVDKEQAQGLPIDIQNTIIAYIAQDFVGAKHPGAAMVVARLLSTAGVLHATPRLAVMADDPLLGEYRETFTGMLGMIEERPDEVEDSPGFLGYERIIGTERLLERLEDSSEDRVDTRAFLRARLMDVIVGDWDRHPDQWRWAEEERAGTRFWLAIPRDRDNAFSHIDGGVGFIARMLRPSVTRFEERYDNIYGLIHNAQVLDRRILSDLTRADWDSVALDLRQRLTDEAIDSAVRALPAEWLPLEAEPLARKLKARRDALPEMSRALYSMMSTEVEAYGTDEVDLAIVERARDGSVRVRLSAEDGEGEPYFDRTFDPADTREVRVHLRGGPDQAVVRGEGGRINVRVLGGGNDDVLEDASATIGGAFTAFYDDRGENTIEATDGTVVDLRTYEASDHGFPLETNAPPPRDWGNQRIPFLPAAGWVTDVGPIVGGGPVWIRYGFRRIPFASRMAVTALAAPFANRYGVRASARFIHTGGESETLLSARATQFGVTSFNGYGNETQIPSVRSLRRIHASEVAASFDLAFHLNPDLTVQLGPHVEIVQPEPRPGSPAIGVPGSADFGVAGVRASGALDTRDSEMVPTSGIRLEAEAATYPATWRDADTFMKAGFIGSTYIPLPGPVQPVIALRLGGERTWGDAPLQYAAFLGGSNLRGYSSQRFAGESAVFGNAELRTNLGRANLVLLTGEIGTIARGDVGRVFVDGEDSDRWHPSAGGGLWFATLEGALAVHLLYAYGEQHTVNVGLGLPF